jgi:hypothetical protein
MWRHCTRHAREEESIFAEYTAHSRIDDQRTRHAEEVRLYSQKVIAVLIPLRIALLQPDIVRGHHGAASEGFKRTFR